MFIDMTEDYMQYMGNPYPLKGGREQQDQHVRVWRQMMRDRKVWEWHVKGMFK